MVLPGVYNHSRRISMEKMTKKEMKAIEGGCIGNIMYCYYWSRKNIFEGQSMDEEFSDCMSYHGC